MRCLRTVLARAGNKLLGSTQSFRARSRQSTGEGVAVLDRPYRRTCRQLDNGSYAEGGRYRYIEHPKYARDADKYVRAYLILQQDIQSMFEYIEPADQNKETYSFRIHALFMRICIELEANLRAILIENGYKKLN